jgi:hypothetical protein
MQKWEKEHRAERTEYQRKRVAKDPKRFAEVKRLYKASHREEVSAYNREYRQRNIDAIKTREAVYKKENRDVILSKLSAYLGRRWRSDPMFRLANSLRKKVGRALESQNSRKSVTTMTLIGCDVGFLKQHIERQFKDGMSWDRRSEWHIDHIVPCSEFDLSDPEQQQKCFHWSNLQPLWKSENLRKSNKIPQELAAQCQTSCP